MDEEKKKEQGQEEVSKETEEVVSEKEASEENIIADAEKDLKDAMEVDFEKVLNEKDEKYKRLFAEFDNYKKRTVKEKENTMVYAKADIIQDMLPIIDALESAMNLEGVTDAVRDGLNLVMEQINEFFAKNNVEEVGKEGEKFNPEYHQAISMEESSEVESGNIITTYRKGYKIGDKIIRHAMVIVSK